MGRTALPEWEVFPKTSWNYGLIINKSDKPSSDFQIHMKGKVADQPWMVENAPVEIRAKGKKNSDWKLENETVMELPQSPVKSNEPDKEITLVPLGCVRLRISCFPLIQA